MIRCICPHVCVGLQAGILGLAAELEVELEILGGLLERVRGPPASQRQGSAEVDVRLQAAVSVKLRGTRSRSHCRNNNYLVVLLLPLRHLDGLLHGVVQPGRHLVVFFSDVLAWKSINVTLNCSRSTDIFRGTNVD